MEKEQKNPEHVEYSTSRKTAFMPWPYWGVVRVIVVAAIVIGIIAFQIHSASLKAERDAQKAYDEGYKYGYEDGWEWSISDDPLDEYAGEKYAAKFMEGYVSGCKAGLSDISKQGYEASLGNGASYGLDFSYYGGTADSFRYDNVEDYFSDLPPNGAYYGFILEFIDAYSREFSEELFDGNLDGMPSTSMVKDRMDEQYWQGHVDGYLEGLDDGYEKGYAGGYTDGQEENGSKKQTSQESEENLITAEEYLAYREKRIQEENEQFAARQRAARAAKQNPSISNADELVAYWKKRTQEENEQFAARQRAARAAKSMPEDTPKPTQEPAATPPYGKNYHGHVYASATGSKYHYENPCGNGEYHEITWDDVRKQKLEPCGKCVLH